MKFLVFQSPAPGCEGPMNVLECTSILQLEPYKHHPHIQHLMAMCASVVKIPRNLYSPCNPLDSNPYTPMGHRPWIQHNGQSSLWDKWWNGHYNVMLRLKHIGRYACPAAAAHMVVGELGNPVLHLLHLNMTKGDMCIDTRQCHDDFSAVCSSPYGRRYSRWGWTYEWGLARRTFIRGLERVWTKSLDRVEAELQKPLLAEIEASRKRALQEDAEDEENHRLFLKRTRHVRARRTTRL